MTNKYVFLAKLVSISIFKPIEQFRDQGLTPDYFYFSLEFVFVKTSLLIEGILYSSSIIIFIKPSQTRTCETDWRNEIK